MAELLENIYEELITESGLSRIYKHIMEHDCACITAFRGQKINCLKSIDDKPEASTYTYKENVARNAKLYAILMGFNYGITRIDGTFIEGFGTAGLEKEVDEDTFFVVNLRDATDFIQNIINLGKHFCQDSVLIKEKGTEGAYLYGTNNHVFPGLNKTVNLSTFRGGIKSEFMSKIKGRPFTFTESRYHNVSTRALFFEKNKREFLVSLDEGN